jgi:hypothetical protein
MPSVRRVSFSYRHIRHVALEVSEHVQSLKVHTQKVWAVHMCSRILNAIAPVAYRVLITLED